MTIVDRRSRESVGGFQITINFVRTTSKDRVERDFKLQNSKTRGEFGGRTCGKASVHDAYEFGELAGRG
jgi:hypothetical protein